MSEHLRQQLDFLMEIDNLKNVLRATPIHDNSRPENSGEHSWHIAMFALILADQATSDVRIDRVIKMLLIHDIVEIDAGDVPIHLVTDPEAQAIKEQAAADRIFNLLPASQAADLRALWDEFEAARSPDAIFAKAIDRVQPLLLNHINGGGSWIDFDVTLEQIDSRVGQKVIKGAPGLWQHVRAMIAPWFTARQSSESASKR